MQAAESHALLGSLFSVSGEPTAERNAQEHFAQGRGESLRGARGGGVCALLHRNRSDHIHEPTHQGGVGQLENGRWKSRSGFTMTRYGPKRPFPMETI